MPATRAAPIAADAEALADADCWPLHDAAAGAALSASIVSSEWGEPVVLGSAPWGHAHGHAAAAAAGHVLQTPEGSGPEEEQKLEAPQEQSPPASLVLAQAVEGLERALTGAGAGAGAGAGNKRSAAQPQQQQRGAGGGLRGALLAAAAAAPRARGGAGATATTAAAGGVDAAAVEAFIKAVSGALLLEEEDGQQLVKHGVWGRLLLQSSSASAQSTAAAGSLLSPQGEARLVALCTALVADKDDAPQPLVRSLLRDAVLPHLRALPGAASRPLVAALAGVAQRRPTLLVDEALLPLLCPPRQEEEGGLGAGVGSAQCEVVTRLVKQGALPTEHLDPLLLGLCLERPRPDPHPSCEWTDLTLPVLTAVLLLAPPLEDGTVLALLERVEGAVAAGGPLAASLKLAALVKALVGKYPLQVRRFRPLVLRVLDRCEGALPVATPVATGAAGNAVSGQRRGARPSSAAALVAAALKTLLVEAAGGE